MLSGPSGVEVGTERVWEFVQERHLPTLFFVSMMDRPNANSEAVYQDIKEHVTPKVIPVEIPIGSGDDFRGIINLFSEKAHIYKSGTQTGEYEEQEIGDLNHRPGKILGIDTAGRNQKVTALVPQAELYKYSTSLRSLTQGRAAHKEQAELATA